MAHTWIPVIVAIVLLSIHGVESVKGKDNALPADWSRDVCYPNTFKSMSKLCIQTLSHSLSNPSQLISTFD